MRLTGGPGHSGRKTVARCGVTDGDGRSNDSLPGWPITIAKVANSPRGATWGADDRIVFGVVDPGAGLQSVPASGGEPRSLTTPSRGTGEAGHYYPFTLPDGKSVLFTIGGPTTADGGQIAVLDLRTGRYETLIRGGSAAVFIEPSPHLYHSRNASGDPVRSPPPRGERRTGDRRRTDIYQLGWRCGAFRSRATARSCT